MSARPPISACVITLNEADRIEACLDSLAFCDEIVVVDSGTTDATCERAAARGARVLLRAFDGYRTQKDHAARNAGFTAAGYRCARATEYFGAFLRHGNAYPDRVLRLFDRRRGGFRGDREIHEHVEVDGAVATLAGDLEHHAYRSLDDQLQRLERYARMMAAHLHDAGRRARRVNILINPAWRFLRGYLLRGGFRDGWRGLVYASVEANYVRQKFIRLWLLQRPR